MSKLDLARKLIFLIGALVSIVMAAVSSWAAPDPFDVDAYRWAPLWVGIPIICFYVVAELLVHWLPSTPIRIGLLLLACVAPVRSGTAQETDRLYPNELPGYQFHARATWRSLQPLVSRHADVTAVLGELKRSGYTFERSWRLTVHYWADGGSCAGRPFPSLLVGTVAYLELVPITRVSFLDMRFPSAFHKVVEMGEHDRVGSWQLYRDEFGLEYRVYDKASSDGAIRAGDLKSIVYGPSRKTYVAMTGCPDVEDE